MKKALQCGIEPGTSCITGICLWQVGGLLNIPQTNYYLTPTVQLKFNFTLARKDMRAFTSFLRGITEYFLSN